MTDMYTRLLLPPDHSFFLFGPRGTGKTTWLKTTFKYAKWFDLLRSDELLKLMRRPEQLRLEVEALGKGSWVVIDEIQKLPQLLNEIHSLIADHGNKYQFALSGSSARKLKRLDSNLLAGRVFNRKFFPLTGAELNYDFVTDDLLKFGTLPKVCAEPGHRIDILEAYVANYIREEIQQEALVQNIASFSRFLEVAAIMNGQTVNVSNIARDAAVARPTVQRYFDALVDTLIGVWLPAWKPRAKVKEVSHPKFYFFDTGVVRATQSKLREPLESAERGHLLETLVLHELRARISMAGCGGELFYWGSPSRSEIDFIWTRGGKSVGIEVKAVSGWKTEYGSALNQGACEGWLQKCFAVYLGDVRLKDHAVHILPLKEFMKDLAQGAIF
ncbi:MAG: AAA family ATPase [Candidatus Omnitrophota bacterium]